MGQIYVSGSRSCSDTRFYLNQDWSKLVLVEGGGYLLTIATVGAHRTPTTVRYRHRFDGVVPDVRLGSLRGRIAHGGIVKADEINRDRAMVQPRSAIIAGFP